MTHPLYSASDLLLINHDIIDLYLLQTPLIHADTIPTLAHVALLLHNDYMYLAHQCIVLSLNYPRLPVLLLQYVDRLRDHAVKLYFNQLVRLTCITVVAM